MTRVCISCFNEIKVFVAERVSTFCILYKCHFMLPLFPFAKIMKAVKTTPETEMFLIYRSVTNNTISHFNQKMNH